MNAHGHLRLQKGASAPQLDLGIICTSGRQIDLLASEMQDASWFRINGNVFDVGRLAGLQVVIVLSGGGFVNVAMIAQLMVDRFGVRRSFFIGMADALDPTLGVGDVVIADAWTTSHSVCDCDHDGGWGQNASGSAHGGKTPSGRRSSLVMSRTSAPVGERLFRFCTDPAMIGVANGFAACPSAAVPAQPKASDQRLPILHVGGLGASTPESAMNTGYGQHMFERHGVRVTDHEAAAFAHVAYANGVPFIAIHKISCVLRAAADSASTACYDRNPSELNALSIALAFVGAQDCIPP